jgi:hypothetical protein
MPLISNPTDSGSQSTAATSASNKNFTKKNLERAKRFFLSSIPIQSPQGKKKMAQCILAGEAFFVTVLRESGLDDVIIAGIQFKRNARGVWINFMATTDKLVLKSTFGSCPGFLEEQSPLRGLGIGLLLLRAVQLYQCCHGSPPNLFIQALRGSDFEAYLCKRGFRDASTSTVSYQFAPLGSPADQFWKLSDSSFFFVMSHNMSCLP